MIKLSITTKEVNRVAQKVTSTDIKLALKEFHNGKPSYFITECKTCSTYFPDPQWLLKFDGLAITKSYTKPNIIGYEIKVSRNDFLQDNKVLKGKGYKVKGVGSVKSALDEIKKDIYDFICTDYNLPDDTGTALLQHEFTKNIPICIMTTSVDRHIFNMAKSLGAVECFDKATFDFVNDLCNCIENKK